MKEQEIPSHEPTAYHEALKFFDFGGEFSELNFNLNGLTPEQISAAGAAVDTILADINNDPNPIKTLSQLSDVLALCKTATNWSCRIFLQASAGKIAHHSPMLIQNIGKDILYDDELALLFAEIMPWLVKKTTFTMTINGQPVDAPRFGYRDDITAALEGKLHELEAGLNAHPEVYVNFFKYLFLRTSSIGPGSTYTQALAAFEQFLDANQFRNNYLMMLYHEPIPEIQFTADVLMARRIEKAFHIEPETILDAWSASGYGALPLAENPNDTRQRFNRFHARASLEAMDAIEKAHPGAVKYLMNEYGIRHFGRYPTDLLIEQFEKRECQGGQPQIIVVFPYDDQSGAFYQLLGKFETVRNDAWELGVTIRVAEVASAREVLARLNRVYRKHGKQDGALIGGHGTPSSMILGPADKRHSTIVLYVMQHEIESEVVGRAIQKFFTPAAPFVLLSCSTGKRQGLAQELSKYGHRVVAPNEDTVIKDLHLKRKGNAVAIDVTYQTDDIHRVYKNGKRRFSKKKSV